MKRFFFALSSSIALALIIVVVLAATALAGPLSVLNTINVGSGSPWGATFNTSNNKAYLSGYGGSVWVVDGTTNALTNTIAVGGTCLGIAANPNTNRIYVARFLTPDVKVIDGSTDTVVGTISIGGINPQPTGVAVNPVTNMVYVTEQNTHELTVINGLTDTVVTTISGLGSATWGVAVNTVTNEVYVTDNPGVGATSLYVIDGNTNLLAHTVPLAERAGFVAVNPVTNKVYAALGTSGQVAVIDGATYTLQTTISGFSSAYGLAVDNTKNEVLVSDYGGGSARLVDGATNTIKDSIGIGAESYGAACNPATTKAYVPCASGNSLAVLQYDTPVTISASANPPAGGTTTGQGTYHAGDTVHMQASPSAGYHFVNWTEGGTPVSTNPDYYFSASTDRTLVANFGFQITLHAGDSGGTVSGGGTFVAGSSVTVHGTPLYGTHFSAWWDPNVGTVSFSADYTFTATVDRTLYGSFCYHVEATANPMEGGTAMGSEPEYGNPATAAAYAHTGYHFLNWTEGGTVLSTDPNYFFMTSSDRSLVANFALNQYLISSSANPSAGGTTTGDGTYNYGDTVNLHALPGTGYHFANWTEGPTVVSTNADYSFTATAARTLVANFAINTYSISSSASPPASGTTTGDGTYNHGDTVNMHALASTDYHFLNWTEGPTVVSTNADYSFTATAARTLVANFAINTFQVNASVSGTGGTVDPLSQTVNHGGDATVNIHPQSGYHVATITDNESPMPLANPYVIDNVTQGHEVVVTFALNPPTVSSIKPASSQPGHQVTISGTDFGNTQGSGHVSINGINTDVVSWSDTKIVVVVPGGATTGPVQVFTSGGGSNTNKILTIAYATWYLAEGSNAWGFNTYINIENPNGRILHAKLTYMDPNAPATGKGIAATRTITLPALSQTSVSSVSDIGPVDFSTRVECLEGKSIAVDRTMFWTGPGHSKAQSGYHSSIGVTAPSKTWYLPEGSSNWGFETWTLVENPNATPAHLSLSYMTQDSGLKVFSKTVPAYSRATYGMASDIGPQDSSIEVTSDTPVIAERSMYRDNRREGSNSLGATAASNDYYLAEGATGYDVGFTTYLLVQNPNPSPDNVVITYQTGKGEVPGPSFTMPAESRKTIRVNDALPADTDVSTHVHGSRPLVAERAMYWDNGTGTAFSSSIGLSSPHMTFFLPDGQTSSGTETWTCVDNPNPGAVRIVVTYLPQNGVSAPVSLLTEIPPKSRASYNMADKIPSGRASILVHSLDGARPIMVERSMYFNNRGAGTDTIGGYSD